MDKKYIEWKIRRLKRQLEENDYITDKLTEAIVGYIVNGDKEKVIAMYNEYAGMLAQRQAWRDEINVLEEELKLYSNKL